MAGTFAVAALALSSPEPARIMLGAQEKFVNETFFRAETLFSVKGVFDRPELSFGDSYIELTGHTETNVDRTNPVSATTSSSFEFSLTDGQEVLTMQGEGLRSDFLHYLRLTELSDELFPGIENVEDQWMQSTEPFLDLLIKNLEPEMVMSDLDAEEYIEMHKILSIVPLLTYKGTLPSGTVEDAKTYHFAVSVRQEALAAVLTTLREFRTGLSSEPEDYSLILARVKSWGPLTGEVWIGKNDWKFRKIVVSSLLDKASGGARIEAQIVFSGFNEPFSVKIPDAIDIEDVIGRTAEGRLTLAGDRTLQIKIFGQEEEPGLVIEEPVTEDVVDLPPPDQDSDGLSDADEAFYGTDPLNPDTDGDGYPDGVEVANGKNPNGPGDLFGFGL